MYLYRIPMAFIMGIGSALTITSLGSASLIKQIAPLLKPVIITNNPLATANNIISLAGTILALMYFIFTRERTGIQAITSRIGRAFIMVMMGATFGSVAMTRFATDIDRVKALVTTDAFWAVPVFAILLIIFIIYDSRAAKKT
jgi:divalent metal cation (Fe/Co/Zn/Cd) transporter